MKGVKTTKLIFGIILLLYAVIAGSNALFDSLYRGYDKMYSFDTPIFWGLCAVAGAILLVSIKD